MASGLGGRLFEALRDRRSLAYTVVATRVADGAGRGALLTYIATSPEREEEARAEMLEELERFTREPVAEAELRQAVNYLAGQAEVGTAERRRAGGGDSGGVDHRGRDWSELDDPGGGLSRGDG